MGHVPPLGDVGDDLNALCLSTTRIDMNPEV